MLHFSEAQTTTTIIDIKKSRKGNERCFPNQAFCFSWYIKYVRSPQILAQKQQSTSPFPPSGLVILLLLASPLSTFHQIFSLIGPLCVLPLLFLLFFPSNTYLFSSIVFSNQIQQFDFDHLIDNILGLCLVIDSLLEICLPLGCFSPCLILQQLLWQVQITLTESEVSFGVGIASDPMSTRRGGKKLPMEDVCYYRCPLPGIEQVHKYFHSRSSFFNLCANYVT